MKNNRSLFIGVFALGVAVIPVVSKAQTVHVFHGPYIGAQGSLTFPNAIIEVDDAVYDLAEKELTDTARISYSDDDLDVRGIVFGGFGFQEGPGYIGFEGHYVVGNTIDDDDLSSADGVAYASVDEEWGVSVRAGIVLWEGTSMLYGRLGYVRGDAELTAGDQSESASLDGTHLGVGIEYGSFDLPIAMRLEPSWKFYGSEDFFDGAELDYSDFSVNLGVSYLFR